MNRFLRKPVEHFGHDLTNGYEVPHGVPFAEVLEKGLEHHRSGRLHMAWEDYHTVLKQEPAHKDALYLMGVWHIGHSEFDKASEYLSKATTAAPDFALAWCQYGTALQGVGRTEDAKEAFRRALELDSRLAEAHYHLGETLQATGDLAGAIGEFRQSVSIDSKQAHVFVSLARAYYAKKQYDEAMSACHSAILADKESAVAYNELGLALFALGQANQAADAFRSAIKLSPSMARAYGNLGQTYLSLREPAQALEMCIQAVQLDSYLATGHCCRGMALRELGRLDEALEAAERALAVEPEMAEAFYVKGCVLFDSCRPEEACVEFRKALEHDQHHAEAHSRLIQALQCTPGVRPAQILKEAEEWGRRYSFSRYAEKPRPLRIERIGFVTGDLGLHPVGAFLEGLFQNIDRSRFKVFVYAHQNHSDAQTDRIKGCADVWRRIIGLDDDTVTEMIGDDEIDVLIDLSGHTRFNRLQVFANHAAPIQVSWLGHFGTTGLPQIDAVIGDEGVTPVTIGGDYAEKILRLPTPYLAYSPPRMETAVTELPCLSGEPFTFGAFCHTAKINKPVVDAWAQILKGVPGSRILIKSRTLVSKSLQKQLLDWFEEFGVANDRVVFRQSATWAVHFGSFGQVDMMLDAFPFHSPMTVLEGAWLGVPTVSLQGEGQHSRLSTRILEELELDGFITESVEEYVGRAVNMAQDVDLLQSLRGSLRGRLMTSRMNDSASFAKAFTNALESLV